MEIRLANEFEKEQVKSLWKYCFYDIDPYLSWFFDTVYKPEGTVVSVENGKVTGALQLLDYTIVIRSVKYPCYYIAGVSTYPHARGGGVGRALMEKAEKIAKSRGIDILILIPTIDNFYEKLGYISCYEKVEYNFSSSSILPEKFSGKIKPASSSDIGVLLNLYHDYMKEFDGYIHRTHENMKNIWEMYNQSNGGIYIFYYDDKPCGYVIYDIDAKTLQADEAVYLNKEGMKGLLWFLYSHNSQTKNVCLRAALHDIISDKLYNGKVLAKKIPTAMMKNLCGMNPKIFVGQIDGFMAKTLYGIEENCALQKNYVNILT